MNKYYYMMPSRRGFSQLSAIGMTVVDYAENHYGEAVVEETEIPNIVKKLQGLADKLMAEHKRCRKHCKVTYEVREWTETQMLTIDNYSIALHPVSRFIMSEETDV